MDQIKSRFGDGSIMKLGDAKSMLTIYFRTSDGVFPEETVKISLDQGFLNSVLYSLCFEMVSSQMGIDLQVHFWSIWMKKVK